MLQNCRLIEIDQMGNLLSDNVAYVIYDPTMSIPERILIRRNSTTLYGGGLISGPVGRMDSDILHRDGFLRVMCYGHTGRVIYAVELFDDGSARLIVRTGGLDKDFTIAGAERHPEDTLYWKRFKIVDDMPMDTDYIPRYGIDTSSNFLSLSDHPQIIRIPVRTANGHDEVLERVSQSSISYLIDETGPTSYPYQKLKSE